MSLLTVIAVNSKPSGGGGGGGSTPFTYENMSNLTTEADGGCTRTAGGSARGNSVQRLSSGSAGAQKFKIGVTLDGGAGMLPGIVRASQIPYTGRSGGAMQLDIWGGNAYVNLDGVGDGSFAYAGEDLWFDFDASRKIRIWKGGAVAYTTFNPVALEDYAFYVYFDGAAAVTTGVLE